jgi:hypothetical protein
VRIVRIKTECLVVLEGDLDDGLPNVKVDEIVSDGLRSLVGAQELLPGARAELTLMVVDDGKIRAARARDFKLLRGGCK